MSSPVSDNGPARPPSVFRLLRWEWRLVRADRGCRATLFALAVLTAAATAAGVLRTRERRAAAERVATQQAENRTFLRSAFTDPSPDADLDRIAGRPLSREEAGHARTLRLIARLPSSLAYFGGTWHALFPPPPLAPLSAGQSDLWPDRYRVTARSKLPTMTREDAANPSGLATGPFDPTALAVILLPLALIALTYDLISGDRERGALALILSQPVPLSRVVLARLAVRAGLPTAIVIGVTGFGLLAGGVDPLADGAPVGFAMWAAVVAAYAAFWAGLALSVNASGGSSVSNAVVMVACWVAVVLVVPSAIGSAAAHRHPVASRSDMVTAEREFIQEAERWGKELAERYYREHPEVVRPDRKSDPYGQTRWVAINREVDRRMQSVVEEQQRGQVAARLSFSECWQAISPALAAKLAMDDLAGTGLEHHLDFETRADRYHTEFNAYFLPLMMARKAELGSDELERVPTFDASGLGDRCHPTQIRNSLLALSGWAAALFGVGHWRLSRSRGRLD